MTVIQLHPSGYFRTDSANHLRNQAASCRRLASVARTARGAVALAGVADQFDADARGIELPLAARRAATIIDAAAAGRWVNR